MSIKQDRWTKRYHINFVVERTHKGDERKEISISGKSNCAFPFERGELYFIIASSNELSLDKCSHAFQTIDKVQMDRFSELLK